MGQRRSSKRSKRPSFTSRSANLNSQISEARASLALYLLYFSVQNEISQLLHGFTRELFLKSISTDFNDPRRITSTEVGVDLTFPLVSL